MPKVPELVVFLNVIPRSLQLGVITGIKHPLVLSAIPISLPAIYTQIHQLV